MANPEVINIKIIDEVSNKLEGIEKKIDSLSASGVKRKRRTDEQIESDKRAKEAEEQHAKALQHLDSTQRKLSGSILNTVGSMTSMLRMYAQYKIINYFTQSISESTEELLKFDKQLRSIGAIASVSPDKLTAMSDGFIDLSNKTEYSASQLAEAGLELSKMGVQSDELMARLSKNADLATVSQVDLLTSIDVSTAVMKSFGFGVDQLDRVMSVLHNTVAGSAIDFTDYAESMKFVAPTAQQVGVSIETTSALIGALGDVGLKGTIASTAIKNMFTELLQPAPVVKSVLHNMGLEGKSFLDVLKGFSEQKVGVRALMDTFNVRSLPPVFQFMKNPQLVQRLLDLIKDKQLEIAGGAKKIRDSWAGQLSTIKNNIVNMGVWVSQMFANTGKSSIFEKILLQMEQAKNWMIDNRELIKSNVEQAIINANKAFDFVKTVVQGLIDNWTLIKGVVEALIVGSLLNKVTYGLISIKNVYKDIVTLNSTMVLANEGFFARLTSYVKNYPMLIGGITTAVIAAIALIDNHFTNLFRKMDDASKRQADISKEGLTDKISMYQDLIKDLRLLSTTKNIMGARGGGYNPQAKAMEEKYQFNDFVKQWLKVDSFNNLGKSQIDKLIMETVQASDRDNNALERINATLEKQAAEQKKSEDARKLLDAELAKSLQAGEDKLGVYSTSKTFGDGLKPLEQEFNNLLANIQNVSASFSALSPKMEQDWATAFEKTSERMGVDLQSIMKKTMIPEFAKANFSGKLTSGVIQFNQGEEDFATPFEKIKQFLNMVKTNLNFLETENRRFNEQLKKVSEGSAIEAISIMGKTRQGVGASASGVLTPEAISIQKELADQLKSWTGVSEDFIRVLQETNLGINRSKNELEAIIVPVDLTLKPDTAELKQYANDAKSILSDLFVAGSKQSDTWMNGLRDMFDFLKTDLAKGIISTFESIAGHVTGLMATVDGYYSVVLQNMEKANQKELTALDKKYAFIDKLASKDAIKAKRYEKELAKEKERLAWNLLEEERKIRQKQKDMAIATAIINGALAATRAFADLGLIGGLIALPLLGAQVAIQIATIDAQEYAKGGMVRGAGNGTSDSIVARVSNGEYIIPAQAVSDMGGERGVRNTINNATRKTEEDSGMFKKGQTLIINIGNMYGSKEYVRMLANELRPEFAR